MKYYGDAYNKLWKAKRNTYYITNYFLSTTGVSCIILITAVISTT